MIREIEERDLEGTLALASLLNMINLPGNKAELLKKIQRSLNSFRGTEKRAEKQEYFFVLEDLSAKKIAGCSLILAKHGTPDDPHTYFSVLDKKKESKTLHIGFLHKILRMGFNYDGPTEIGALVLLPDYRGNGQKLGKALSFVRFMYMAARPQSFQKEVLSELMPRFGPQGEAPIWEDIGRKFTNLTYTEADKLSRSNKEFITSLYPEGDIYTCMLSAEARNSIGQVGKQTEPVRNILESIGFEYRNMIDPFDGGPHYWAKTSEIKPVKETQKVFLEETDFKGTKDSGLLMVFSKKGLRVLKDTFVKKENKIAVSALQAEALCSDESAEAYFLSL